MLRATRRHDPVHCPVCDRTVERRSRPQRFCSSKCRKRASRRVTDAVGMGGSGATDLNAPAAVSCDAPPEKPNDFKGRFSAKTGWSDGIVGPREVIEVEVIAGRRWQETVSVDGVTIYASRIAGRALQDGGAP
jgi:hypothetical protein